MSFTPTDTMPGTPDVTIFFSGLMILTPTNNNMCEVFVNSSAPRHFLTIEVRRKQAGRPDELMMRHVGPLAFAPTDQDAINGTQFFGMQIKKVTANGATGVQRFVPNAPQPDGAPDGLAAAIDLHRNDFHKDNPVVGNANSQFPFRLLDVEPLGSRPSILLQDGVLYTAAKTRAGVNIQLTDVNGNKIRDMEPFASLIGAAIALEANTHVEIQWRQQGKTQVLKLDKVAATTYEIYIVNDPLFESETINPDTDPKHDELQEYYKILSRVPTEQQFRLEVPPLDPNAPPPDRGSTRAPCMSVLLGGGD